MNLDHHRSTKFVHADNLRRHNRTPLLQKEQELLTEYSTNVFEISKKKRFNTDKIPITISLFIYQQSKLHFYKFVMLLHDYLVTGSYKLLYMDTDSLFDFKMH